MSASEFAVPAAIDAIAVSVDAVAFGGVIGLLAGGREPGRRPSDRGLELARPVRCGAGSVLGLERVQRPGRKVVSARDWVNGERIEPGDRFDGGVAGDE